MKAAADEKLFVEVVWLASFALLFFGSNDWSSDEAFRTSI